MTGGEPVGCVDVAMVAFGNADEIGACVADLLDREEVGSVTVVDHGRDGSAAAAQAVGAAVFEDPTNPGFGAGMNRAVAAGSAPYVLVMNPDARLLPGVLGAGLAEMAARPQAAAVQGMIRTPSTGRLERAGGRELGWIDLLGRALGATALLRFRPVARLVRRAPALSHQVDRGTGRTVDVATLAATAVVVRRAAFEEVGGFDRRYFLYGEDLDLCRRLRRAGWELWYLPIEWAEHENGSSSDGWWAREQRWWEGTMSFAARWWGAAEFRLGQVAALVMVARLARQQPGRWRDAWRSLVTVPAAVRRSERSARRR